MTLGEPGLTRQGLWTGQIKRFAEQVPPTEPDWRTGLTSYHPGFVEARTPKRFGMTSRWDAIVECSRDTRAYRGGTALHSAVLRGGPRRDGQQQSRCSAERQAVAFKPITCQSSRAHRVSVAHPVMLPQGRSAFAGRRNRAEEALTLSVGALGTQPAPHP
jgi:hypothetical protein